MPTLSKALCEKTVIHILCGAGGEYAGGSTDVWACGAYADSGGVSVVPSVPGPAPGTVTHTYVYCHKSDIKSYTAITTIHNTFHIRTSSPSCT